MFNIWKNKPEKTQEVVYNLDEFKNFVFPNNNFELRWNDL